jgi:hypothetical protein
VKLLDGRGGLSIFSWRGEDCIPLLDAMGRSADVDAGAGFIWKRSLKASASLSSDGTEPNRLVQLICIEKFTDDFCEYMCLTCRKWLDTAASS